MSQAKLILCVVIVTGSLLFSGAFFVARQSPLWIRFSCLFAGIAGVVSGYLYFQLEYHRRALPYRTRAYLDHYSTLLGGAAMGAIVVLGIYGLALWANKRGANQGTPARRDSI
jgi:hypothetical protein